MGFELVEYTLEYQLPNFEECWWDHVRQDGSTVGAMQSRLLQSPADLDLLFPILSGS